MQIPDIHHDLYYKHDSDIYTGIRSVYIIFVHLVSVRFNVLLLLFRFNIKTDSLNDQYIYIYIYIYIDYCKQ